MLGDILKVKTNIPPLGANILPLPRVLGRLEEDLLVEQGFTRQLTLVSAPAGFGKTTQVRKWLEGWEGRAAWYSLDQGDNEPERFWIYLISALQNLKSGIGSGSLEMLRSDALSSRPSRGTQALLTPLLNDLFALPGPLLLVLDDYHLVNNTQVHKDLVFFIENLPPALHLVVITRSDPPWPLSRWRARGKMAELRLKDLKFSSEEAGRLLTGIKGIQLEESQLETLYHKTEGWVTGLHLAAFSLSHSSNAGEFINNFAGSHRHILHFLSEEVFSRQPQPVQDFLLETSILTRFNGSLCDRVTGRKDSCQVLAGLERENLFVLPLDEEGTWYRYHPLFSDLLLHYLKNSYPEKIASLQERAVGWYLEAGEAGEAVRQALGAGDLEQVGRILHDNYDEILQQEGPLLLNRCLDGMSPELIRGYPRLAAHKAMFYLVHKGREAGRPYLELAEEIGYEDPQEQEGYLGLLTTIKSYFDINDNNLKQALENTDKALQLLSPRSNYWRMCAAIFSGDARLFSGKPGEACSFYQEAHRNSKKLGYHYLTLNTGFKIATSLCYQGKLGECQELSQGLLQVAREEGLARVPITGAIWVLLGEVLREEGRLEEAGRCIERGLLYSQPEKPPLGWNSLYKVALCFSREDYAGALDTLGEIYSLHREYNLPLFITLAAATWEARVLLETGDMARAREVLSKAGINREGEVQGGQERGFLALARLMLAEGEEGGDLQRARQVLDLLEGLNTRGRYRSFLMETLLTRALLEEKAGSPGTAEGYLSRALQAGFTSGYYQVFQDQGKGLAAVFKRVLEKMGREGPALVGKSTSWENPELVGKSPSWGGPALVGQDMLDYARELGRALSPGPGDTRERPGPGGTTAGGATAEPTGRGVKPPQRPVESTCQGLVEELSPRELEVLALISQGLSNQAISQKLYLTLGTVKWHTSNIYGKLGVRNRTQAAALARELGLLTQAGDAQVRDGS